VLVFNLTQSLSTCKLRFLRTKIKIFSVNYNPRKVCKIGSWVSKLAGSKLNLNQLLSSFSFWRQNGIFEKEKKNFFFQKRCDPLFRLKTRRVSITCQLFKAWTWWPGNCDMHLKQNILVLNETKRDETLFKLNHRLLWNFKVLCRLSVSL